MTTKQKRRTAAEIIAFHFSCDIKDVSEGRYQSTRFSDPAVYVMGEDYFCCPKAGQKPAVDKQFPDRWDWKEIGEWYGRKVYRAKGTA